MITQPHALELIAKYRAGDRRAADELARLTLPLLRAVARRYRSLDPDDAEQIAYLGFMRALETYDSERGAAWTTYCTSWARSALDQEGRRLLRRRRATRGAVLSLDEPRGDTGATLLEFVRAPEAETGPLPSVNLLRLLEALSAKQRYVVERRLQGWTWRRIGAELGVTPQTVSANYRAGVRRLRRALVVSSMT